VNEIENNQVDMDASGPNSSALDLRGRQSVRATFRLSEDCIDWDSNFSKSVFSG